MTYILILLLLYRQSNLIVLPIQSNSIKLTSIGEFGYYRAPRTLVEAHLHTGIDITRPDKNYKDEPVLSIANGFVISRRDDGPYAQVIIEHSIDSRLFWSVYEHISGIQVMVGEEVRAGQQVARFMNLEELNNYGWQFDHVHFEILKKAPRKIRPNKKHPNRHFNSYTLQCNTEEVLHEHFYDPVSFLH